MPRDWRRPKNPKEVEEDKASILVVMGDQTVTVHPSRDVPKPIKRRPNAGSIMIAIRRLRSSELHSPDSDFHQLETGTGQQLMQHWQRMQPASLDRGLPVDFHYHWQD